MSSYNEWTVRVLSVRSRGRPGLGGGLFSARPISDTGEVLSASSYLVVKLPGKLAGGTTVQVGQWWKVAGDAHELVREVNGYQATELQVEPESAELLRPSGEHIVAFMADNPDFRGVGRVKARRLWDALGDKLYEALDSGDTAVLKRHLTPELTVQAIAAWRQHGDTRTLQWLHAHGFDVALGKKVIEFFGSESGQKIEDDPYRLLSFCGDWDDVDAIARSEFGVALDDPRRLQAAIEEACYRIFAAGHTTALAAEVIGRLEKILGSQTETFRWRDLVREALSSGLSNGSYVLGPLGIQPLGASVMERQVASAVAERLLEPSPPVLPREEVTGIIEAFDRALGALPLNPEQRQAVYLAADHSFLLITGGAGVGKTTVLRAIFDVYDAAGIEVTQLALAGRAAMRMKEATGRPASTIAHFLHTFKDGQLDGESAVVVDEASMVDIVTMSRLCAVLPPHARLILVGDPAQLMPVGPGLVLHALTRVPQVPQAELKVPERFGSEIAGAAASVRNGTWPIIAGSELSPVVFVTANGNGKGSRAEPIDDAVLRLRQQDPADTQILCASKGGPGGVHHLNERCRTDLSVGAPPVAFWSLQHEQEAWTGLRVGDPVMCTRNLWDRGLQNGSMGTIVERGEKPSPPTGDSGGGETVLAWIDWDDNIRRPLTPSMLEDVTLGFAITVHKAQGSQWPRVIVPLSGSRWLDRTLIYTAMTRARRQVVLVGDEVAAKAAVEALPQVARRQVALDLILSRLLAARSGKQGSHSQSSQRLGTSQMMCG